MIRVTLSEKQVGELESASGGGADPKLRDRARMVLMTHRGRTREQVSLDLGVTPRTVQRWLNSYLERGLEGLRPRKAKGAAGKIPPELGDEVRRWVIEGPASQGLDRANWTYEELAAHLGLRHGVRVSKSAVAVFCRRQDIRPYRPTYRFLRGDPAKQAEASAELAALKRGRKTGG